MPQSWEQGRGAYGGLVFAAMLRAMERETAAPPRVLQGMLPNVTAAGNAVIRTHMERKGATTATVSASVEQLGGKTGVATLLAGTDRNLPPTWQTQTKPTAPAWDQVPEVRTGPFVPAFLQHMSARPLSAPPFSKAPRANVLGWIGLREPCVVSAAVYVTALIDAYWPSAMSVFATPRLMTTIGFTLEFCALDDVEIGEPLLLSGEAPVARGGFVYETRDLWTGDGVLVARNHQTYAVLG